MEAGKTRSNVTEGEYLSQRRVAQSKLLDDDDHVELDKVSLIARKLFLVEPL